MDMNKYKTSRRKNKHLNKFEHRQIETLRKEGLSANAIDKHLDCS